MAQAIIFNNITVDGAPFTHILELHIHNEMNSYGFATVTGEVSAEAGKGFLLRSNAGTIVTISTTAAGQPKVLFIGVVSGSSIAEEGDFSRLTLRLSSTASMLDDVRENHSYQQTSATYEEIIKKALDGRADLEIGVSDRATRQLIMQYNETAWVFARRMASSIGGAICASITCKVPKLFVGAPSGGRSYEVSTTNYGATINGIRVTSNQYCEVGDTISFEAGNGMVNSVDAVMEGGMLKTTVEIGKRDVFANQVPIPNPSVAGRMMKGIVQAVERDKVQVHFVDIDSNYGNGDLWLPYSTAYSSSDGSGFYCMPQEGDEVRVFMPSDNEGDAFAASSVNVSPLDNPKHKKWKSPAGKEILMTEGGMYITCKEQRIFINLEDETGITICSDSDINVMTMNNMLVYAQKELKVQAENKILLSTGSSYIDMQPGEIQLGAEKVTIK